MSTEQQFGNIGNISVSYAGYQDVIAPNNITHFGPLQADDKGRLLVSAITTGGGGDTHVNTGPILPAATGIVSSSINYLFDGTDFDRQRANTQETVLASAARTATVNSADFINHNAKGADFIINVSALAATPSIVPTIQGKDPVSGNYYNLLVGTAITTVGINVLKVYPGIAQIANESASNILPRIWRVSLTHADADSITYSVGANLVL